MFHPLVFISWTSCCLSILGASLLFLTYARMPDIRNYTRKLLMYLTLADLMTASGYMLSVVRYTSGGGKAADSPAEDPLCRIQSLLTTFSSMASFFWTVIIAVHLHTSVVYGSRHADRGRWLVVFHVVGWIVPGIVTLLAVGYGVLGQDGTSTASTGPTWCWITSKADNKELWMLFTGKAWEILCYILTAVLYLHLKCYLLLQGRNLVLSDLDRDLRNEDKNFLYVWLILYLLRMWGTLRCMVYIAGPNNMATANFMDVLLYLQALGDPGQAFGNFLLFCVADTSVRRHLRNFFRCRRRSSRRRSPDSDISGIQDNDVDPIADSSTAGRQQADVKPKSLYGSVDKKVAVFKSTDGRNWAISSDI